MRGAACAHEYLLASSCKGRYFCPSCHAKRLTLWALWLEETLLAPVPHRQVVLTIPKRLRPWCLYRRGIFEAEDAEAMLAWPHAGLAATRAAPRFGAPPASRPDRTPSGLPSDHRGIQIPIPGNAVRGSGN